MIQTSVKKMIAKFILIVIAISLILSIDPCECRITTKQMQTPPNCPTRNYSTHISGTCWFNKRSTSLDLLLSFNHSFLKAITNKFFIFSVIILQVLEINLAWNANILCINTNMVDAFVVTEIELYETLKACITSGSG